MRLYHVLDDSRRLYALRHGLRPSDAAGDGGGIRLYDRKELDVILDVARRKDWLGEICVLVVSVPQSWCEPQRPGVWVCRRYIPPQLIKGELYVDMSIYRSDNQ